MKKAIFDLDGTLADNTHRLHLIKGEEKKWREYLGKVKQDELIGPTKELLEEVSEDYEIIILTARSNEARDETIEWLNEKDVKFDKLIMLDEGRWNIPDAEFKEEEVLELEDVKIAVDDKESVCKMFKKHVETVYRVEWNEEPEIVEY